MFVFSICYHADKAFASDQEWQTYYLRERQVCIFSLALMSFATPSVSVEAWLTDRKTPSAVQHLRCTQAPLEPTIESRDPEDLCDVHSNDVEATGSPLRQEPDHHLQKLFNEERRHVWLSEPGNNVILIIVQRVFYCISLLHRNTHTSHTQWAAPAAKVTAAAEGWTCVLSAPVARLTRALPKHVSPTVRHLSVRVSKSILKTCSWAIWMD